MERYMLDGFQDAELYAELAASDTFPLVRELEFKYGLKVVRKAQTRPPKTYGTSIPSWQLAHKNGLMVCDVYQNDNGGKDQKEKVFCYYSPHYAKERGANYLDKNTIQSVKVSSLMATLSRHKVVPPMDKLAAKALSYCSDAKQLIEVALGNSSKSNSFTSDEVHAMLSMVLGVSPSVETHALDLDKCKKELDKMNAADKLKQEKKDRTSKMFDEPFFFVGVDEAGHYLIGKYKRKPKEQTVGKTPEYEAVEPIKRYKSYTEVRDLIPIMTMVKQIYEGGIDGKYRMVDVMPITDEYNEDLDAVFFYQTAPSPYDCIYMVTPCPA
jgi:hypothetical protein